MATTLITPSRDTLPDYVAALEQGWSPDNVRGKAAANEQLARIATDPDAFVESLDDPEARGGPIPLPDGTLAERLPGITRWIWDDGFCGSIGFRWRPGSEALPPTCLGHVGCAVVPWKAGRGHAKAALALILPQAAAKGLRWIDLTTDPANLPSRRVILANGGELLERFVKPDSLGGGEGLRYRIGL